MHSYITTNNPNPSTTHSPQIISPQLTYPASRPAHFWLTYSQPLHRSADSEKFSPCSPIPSFLLCIFLSLYLARSPILLVSSSNFASRFSVYPMHSVLVLFDSSVSCTYGASSVSLLRRLRQRHDRGAVYQCVGDAVVWDRVQSWVRCGGALFRVARRIFWLACLSMGAREEKEESTIVVHRVYQEEQKSLMTFEGRGRWVKKNLSQNQKQANM